MSLFPLNLSNVERPAPPGEQVIRAGFSNKEIAALPVQLRQQVWGDDGVALEAVRARAHPTWRKFLAWARNAPTHRVSSWRGVGRVGEEEEGQRVLELKLNNDDDDMMLEGALHACVGVLVAILVLPPPLCRRHCAAAAAAATAAAAAATVAGATTAVRGQSLRVRTWGFHIGAVLLAAMLPIVVFLVVVVVPPLLLLLRC